MKKFTLYSLIFISIQITSCATYSQTYSDDDYPQDDRYQDGQDISYQSFYDDLSPYGEWVDNPEYGNVWVPYVDDGFKPYATNGHWVYTDYGWTWVSGYSWGWATFHYGRWFYDDDYGWMWVPGYDWAPAWVSWRNSDDYYGWAPLGPSVTIGISLESYNPPVNYWCFAPHEYITRPNIYNYCANEDRNRMIINHTTIINNTVINNFNGSTQGSRFFNAGPRASEVERFTHNSIRPLTISNNNRPGTTQISNNVLSLYRPRVNPNMRAIAGQRLTPGSVPSFGRNNQPEYNRTFSPSMNNNRPQREVPSNMTFHRPEYGAAPFYGKKDIPAASQSPVQEMDNRRNTYNNRPIDQRNTAFQNQPSAFGNQQRHMNDLPFYRNNHANDNGFVQMPAPQQRMTNMQPMVQNRSMQQIQNNNPFGNRRGFERRER